MDLVCEILFVVLVLLCASNCHHSTLLVVLFGIMDCSEEDEPVNETFSQAPELNEVALTPFILRGGDADFQRRNQEVFGDLESKYGSTYLSAATRDISLPQPNQPDLSDEFLENSLRACSTEILPSYLHDAKKYTVYNLENTPEMTDGSKYQFMYLSGGV